MDIQAVTSGRTTNPPTGLALLSVINIILSVSSVAVDVVIVSLVIVLNLIVKIAVEDFNYDLISIGMWAGLFYGVTGIIGIFASYKRTKPIIVISLIFSIFSFIFALGASTLAGFRTVHYDAIDKIVSTPVMEISLAVYYQVLTYLECALTIISVCSAMMNLCIFILLSISLSKKKTNQNRGPSTRAKLPTVKIVTPAAVQQQQLNPSTFIHSPYQMSAPVPVQQRSYLPSPTSTMMEAPTQLPITHRNYQKNSLPTSPRIPIPPPLPVSPEPSVNISFKPSFSRSGYMNQQANSLY